MGIRENKVEKYLSDEVTKIGGVTRKWVSPGQDGVPDRIVIVKTNSPVWLVEVKTIDGKLSTPQIREHHRLVQAGAKVTTVYGYGGVDKFIFFLKQELKYET